MSEVRQYLLLLVMISLFAAYLVLNASKWVRFPAQMQALVNGQPAMPLTIPLRDAPAIDLRLPTSDIFDAEGRRQLSFHYPTARQFESLAKGDRNTVVRMNGLPVPATVDAGNGWLAVVLSSRKIYLLARRDIQILASVLRRETEDRDDIAGCDGPADHCRHMEFSFDEGWGPLTGPVPGVDISLTGDDLPRGRWVQGLNAVFIIGSGTGGPVTIDIELLRTGKDQLLKVNGQHVGGRMIAADRLSQDYQGMSLFRTRYRLQRQLVPGNNRLSLAFSSVVRPAGQEQKVMAAYVSKITVLAGSQAP